MPRGQRRHRAQQFFLGASVLCAAFVLSIPAYAKKQTYAGLFLIHKAGGNVVWYVHPKDRKRYCMKTPEIAYELVPMIALQRILPKDIQKIPKKGESIRGRAFPKKYVGRLLIEQRHPPRLWYVDPRTKRRYRIEIPAEGRIALDVLTTRGVRVATQVLSAIPIAVGCPEEQSNGLQPPFARSIFVPSCETLQIRWDLSERADAYQIYRNGIAIGTVGSDTSTFIDTQLDATKKYTYGVLALNKQGTSPMTEFTSWQPHACPQQPQPSVAPSPSLVPTSSTLPTVLPSSSPSPRPTATPTPTNTPAPLPTPTPTPTPIPLPTPTPTIPPTPPPPGGATSTPIPLAANAVPPTPTFLGVVSVDCRTFLLRWNDVDGEDGYHIYRDGTLFGTTGKGVTEWKDSGLVPAFNYRYSLRAFNAFGDSAHSSTLSFRTGQCSAVGQTLAPPTAILINGTSPACAAKKGTTCLRGAVCPTRWIEAQNDDRCCASTCVAWRAADQCNHNSICETFEQNTCGDCQCKGGVVCGGLCYAGLTDDATCVNGTLVHNDPGNSSVFYCADTATCPTNVACLLPGPCLANSAPITMTVALPSRLPFGTWMDGTVTFLNRGTLPLVGNLFVEINGMDFEIVEQGATRVFPARWNMGQFAPQNPVVYAVRARIQTLTDGFTALHQLKRATLGIRFVQTGSALQQTFIGVQSPGSTPCGSRLWNLAGSCQEAVYYPGTSCTSGAACFGRAPNWKSWPATYAARGTFQVLFLTVDLDAAQQGTFSETSFLNQGTELQKFYTREAERIVGKPMVEFRYTFGGHQQWSIPDGQFLFLNGRETVREYLQRQLPQLQLRDFQFIVLAVPTLPAHQIGEVNGYYLGEGVTTIRAVTGAMHAASMAHEFAHAFGCSDLWMGGVNRYYLCNERRANNLMCGAETHAPELVWFDRIQNGYTTLAYRRLDDCAAEMGWGDADNDGIVDVEDPSAP